jgi:hypothetical protein
MKRTILVLALAAIPAAARAQVPPAIPQPIPVLGRDTMVVPPVALLVPAPENRVDAVVSGVVQGAAIGAIYGASLAQNHPRCAPADTPGSSAVEGATIGGIWGGVRALLGLRPQARIRTVAANDRAPGVSPRPDPNRGPVPPLADERCLASPASPGEARR